jgi:NAD(P)-dependent dehydrogenase (short-subunit alcohol dehydrogenase family)
MTHFRGKTALVTGGARGQGAAIAAALARQGCDLAIWDVPVGAPTQMDYALAREEDMRAIAEEIGDLGGRIEVYEADVRSMSSVESALADTIRDFGGIDVIVCAAGVRSVGSAAEMTDEMWTDVIDTNLHGTYHTVRAALPHLIEGGGGAILIIAAEEGRRGTPLLSHYAAAAWAQIGLAKSIAWEAAADHVSAVVLCTAAVRTAMSDSPSYRRSILAGRAGTAVVPVDFAPGAVDEALMARHPTGIPFVPMKTVVSAALYCLENHIELTGGVVDVSLGLSATNTC